MMAAMATPEIIMTVDLFFMLGVFCGNELIIFEHVSLFLDSEARFKHDNR